MKFQMHSVAKFLLVVFLALFATQTHAQEDCFPAKNENQLVYDQSHLLSTSQVSQLENELDSLARVSGNQIVLVIVEDLCGYEPYAYATELGESWGVGQKENDNGIVFLIKPKRLGSKGEAFIAVGRGLHDVIPDAISYTIVQKEFIPLAKKEDYFGGIEASVKILKDLALKKYPASAYSPEKKTKLNWAHIAGIIIFFVVLFGAFIFFKFKSVKSYAKTNNLGFWAAWALMASMQNKHRGYYNNFRSGSGGFGGWGGGSSGGGFGGFGGGSFGGGGAGGSW
jgi:uncharacterized protein